MTTRCGGGGMSGTVLLIQNDQERRRLVHAQLEPRGHTIIDCAFGAMTHDMTVTTKPDLVVVDSEIAGALPEDFLDIMSSDVRISDVPVLVTNTSRITDLVVDVEVHLQMSRLRSLGKIEPTEMTDPLTGIYSATHMKSELAHFSAVATRYRQQLAVMLLGLDRFESTNRIYGIGAGDEVLVDIAQRLSTDVRDSDIVGRWGGDKFIAILPCTSKNGAGFLAERFREILAESQHRLDNGTAVSITASFGCSDTTDGDIVSAAEAALKMAKRSGRNAVSFSN